MKKIVLIVGASGVGKDTLLKQVKTKIDAHFVKRHITRIPDSHEENYYINDDEYLDLNNLSLEVSKMLSGLIKTLH